MRLFLEQNLVMPLRIKLAPALKPESSLKVLSLEEQIKQLKAENKLMREQLGAIPERANLLPAKVIWQSDSEFMLAYQPSGKIDLMGSPVVLGELFLGIVTRQSPSFLMVKMPISSSFVSEAITGQNTQGKIKGQFNNQVLFETESKQALLKNNRVYYLDKQKGYRLYLGKISQVNQDKRLAIQQALVDFEAAQTQLQTVFIVL